jgi:hypothetical protein
MNGASTAQSHAAAKFSSLQVQFITQNPKKWHLRVAVVVLWFAVDFERDHKTSLVKCLPVRAPTSTVSVFPEARPAKHVNLSANHDIEETIVSLFAGKLSSLAGARLGCFRYPSIRQVHV